jgi:RNA polymerase sigma factor (sigma-70 family)
MRDAGPDEYLPTRGTLLGRLKNLDDQESWRDFFETYWKLIYNSAVRAGLSHADAEEVVQETVLTVTKRIRDLKYDPALGSFKGWLLNTVRWRVADQFRKRTPGDAAAGRPGDGERTATIERVADGFDWDALWEREWKKNLMDAAIERVKQEVRPRQFQIFDLYVLKEWPVRKITRTLGVSAAQVYLAKHRVAAALRRQYREVETKLF